MLAQIFCDNLQLLGATAFDGNPAGGLSPNHPTFDRVITDEKVSDSIHSNEDSLNMVEVLHAHCPVFSAV